MKQQKRYKYYHEEDFNRIKKLINQRRLDAALVEYQNYLERFPGDYCCYAHYADLLIKLGKFEEAKQVLDKVVISSKIPRKSLQNIMLITIKLLSCTHQYQECLELVRENFEMFDERNWEGREVLIFLKKKLGLLTDVDYSGYSYKVDQITSYNEEKAIDCIKRCHLFSDKNPPFYFNEDFPIEEVFYKIKNLFPLDNKTYNDITSNGYIFKYDNNGIVNGKKVDYIEVITINDTNDIITMYPCESSLLDNCIDITPEILEDKSKIKRLSQIDKFNQRYNRNF